MKIITSLEDTIDFEENQTGVALGNFDGLHIGHQALIVNLVEICKKNNLKSVVYTFRNHPKSLTDKNHQFKKIFPSEKKFNLLRELGIDYICYIEFNEEQRKLMPEQFIKKILKNKLNMGHAVVGFDYRFGYGAQGDIHLLKELREKYSYGLTVIEAVKIQDEVISSTSIRNLIREGNFQKANLFLGRHHSISGTVIKGKSLGKKFGIPTANISVEPDLILPSYGVYFTKCIVEDTIYYSITNIGNNPTVEGNKNTVNIETHILDFNKDIYGKKIEIFFYQKCRSEKKYSCIDSLFRQVNQDIASAKKFFGI